MKETNPYTKYFMFVSSFNAAHYFQLNFLFIYFLIVFFLMLENHAPPSWKFSSLVINSSVKRSSHVIKISSKIPFLEFQLLLSRVAPSYSSLPRSFDQTVRGDELFELH